MKCIVTSVLLRLLFGCYIFFHSFTLKLLVSWSLKYLSCRQHTIGSCFLNLIWHCLLIGVFCPFTFNVITDMVYLCLPSLLFLSLPAPSLLPTNTHTFIQFFKTLKFSIPFKFASILFHFTAKLQRSRFCSCFIPWNWRGER